MSLFTDVKFVLWDPATFHAGVFRHGDAITVHKGCFTDAVTRSVRQAVGARGCLFLCDFRSIDEDMAGNRALIEQRVKVDMAAQKRWVEIIEPTAALLKFRLPYAAGTTRYLPGRIRLQAFGPQTTTETRLEVTAPRGAEVAYDNWRCKDQMFYFNTMTRATTTGPRSAGYWANAYTRSGYDHCVNCASQAWILREYCARLTRC
jgi:hypothetical protein